MTKDLKRGQMKRRGGQAAKAWLSTADTREKVRLAGYDFDYGVDTLDDLRQQDFNVPSSADVMFSWGFYKQVKGHVFHKVHFGRHGEARSTIIPVCRKSAVAGAKEQKHIGRI